MNMYKLQLHLTSLQHLNLLSSFCFEHGWQMLILEDILPFIKSVVSLPVDSLSRSDRLIMAARRPPNSGMSSRASGLEVEADRCLPVPLSISPVADASRNAGESGPVWFTMSRLSAIRSECCFSSCGLVPDRCWGPCSGLLDPMLSES